MTYDPAHPTVAGLLAARKTSAFFRTEPFTGPGPEGLLVEALSGALRPGSALVRRPIVDTPLGPRAALLAVVAGGRRIAVLSRRPEEPTAASVVLVYGTFDAVYEVSEEDLTGHVPEVARSIASDEVRLFTPAGRRALTLCALPGRRTTPSRQAASDRGAVAPIRKHEQAVRRLRLNRPADWSASFDHALATGHSYALTA